MTDQEKLLYIEAERAKLEKRLCKKTGLKVTTQTAIHDIGSNGNNRTLARAALQIGWRVDRHHRCTWIQAPVFSGTTIFFSRLEKPAKEQA